MSLWFSLWLGIGGAVGASWLIRMVAAQRIARNRIPLSSWSYDGPPQPSPGVSILVAAKDEEANIETCVTSLLDQDYPDFELVVIDDRSSDRTPEILQRLQAQSDGRLRVLTITELRGGWLGKSNAMREGMTVARGEWLFFTDADCRFTSPKALSMAMRDAIAHESDFLSVTPVLETRAAWEKVIQPVCALALMVWFLPHRVNKKQSKIAYANGAFMLMSRRCYEGIGGHERVKDAVSEDIQMARNAKSNGFHLRVVENEDLYTTRMYDTPLAAWRGWCRIFSGSLGTVPKLAISLLMLMFFSILPWASLAMAAIGFSSSSGEIAYAWTVAIWMWAVVVAMEQMAIWRMYGFLRGAPGWSLTYLPGCIVVAGMMVSAMAKVMGIGRMRWRGTTYRLDGQIGVPISAPSSAPSGDETPDDTDTVSAQEPAAHA